jgi:hypothetical protein
MSLNTPVTLIFELQKCLGVLEQNLVTHSVCLSVAFMLFMKQLEMKSFLTRGASLEGEGVGCNKCHVFSKKGGTAGGL